MLLCSPNLKKEQKAVRCISEDMLVATSFEHCSLEGNQLIDSTSTYDNLVKTEMYEQFLQQHMTPEKKSVQEQDSLTSVGTVLTECKTDKIRNQNYPSCCEAELKCQDEQHMILTDIVDTVGLSTYVTEKYTQSRASNTFEVQAPFEVTQVTPSKSCSALNSIKDNRLAEAGSFKVDDFLALIEECSILDHPTQETCCLQKSTKAKISPNNALSKIIDENKTTVLDTYIGDQEDMDKLAIEKNILELKAASVQDSQGGEMIGTKLDATELLIFKQIGTDKETVHENLSKTDTNEQTSACSNNKFGSMKVIHSFNNLAAETILSTVLNQAKNKGDSNSASFNSGGSQV
jgi:hypothetical protein